ncbi:MAG TPA: AAC(3) family N-acetyltransferase [Anaerolineales bacterium]|nr:AAC(3) family N-acetyltransferase [Anaerolineales bacterium]
MLDYDELKSAFQELDLANKPVIAHASLKPFGYIQNGADAVLQALSESVQGVIMPAFTYRTMITPETGPSNNGITYGGDQYYNREARPFTAELPADSMMGILPETLRNHPLAKRTSHPILSFAGLGVDSILGAQTLHKPFAPIAALADEDGWVVLINVDHTVNTSIHYAEKLAGRKQFLRWALMDNRILECPNFPGDSSGFNAVAKSIHPHIRRVEIGDAFIQALPLRRLFDAVQELIKRDPLALLCQRMDCERCNAVKNT